MIYGSVCSGIEAATVAWHPLGWKCAWVSEIDEFPSAVIAHRWGIKNYGDFTKIAAGGGRSPKAIELLVGGTPCQSFSVAGLRAGLADDRGNLALEFLRLAGSLRPRWVVWENVPGVLSSLSHDAPDPSLPNEPLDMELDGQEVETQEEYTAEELHAFNCFLAGLSELGYGWAYRVLDAQYFGVPQRRRRPFVVAYLGDWRPPAAVLFERECMSWNPAPCRTQGQRVAGTIKGGSGVRGYSDPSDGNGGGMIAAYESRLGIAAFPFQSFGEYESGGGAASSLKARDHKDATDLIVQGGFPDDVAACLETTSNDYSRADGFNMVTHPLTSEGYDATEDGTGRGVPVIAIQGAGERSLNSNGDGMHEDVMYAVAFHASQNPDVSGDVTHPLARNYDRECAIAFRAAGQERFRPSDIAPPIAATDGGGAGVPTIAFKPGQSAKARTLGIGEDVSPTVEAGNGGNNNAAVARGMSVRRLTPRECERLQGFPDDYTLIPFGKKGKPAADGPRYRVLGNCMAVPVMRWLGERIESVDKLFPKATKRKARA